MTFINQVLVDGVRLMARETVSAPPPATTTSAPASVSSVVTSAISSIISSASSAALSSSGSLSSAASSTASDASPSSTVVNGQPGSPGGNNNNPPVQNKDGGGSSPLLFFVALGFGVVFTNLWIIVGVKYCFRYNARNRRLRMGEDGEPINLEAMPRPHRRRREKKLMSMDEVNEKFPMQKYKNWVAGRAQEGLPTRGGVTAPSSRANSLHEADGIVPELPSKERASVDQRERPTTSATSQTKPETGPGTETKDHAVVDTTPAPYTDIQIPATIKETDHTPDGEIPVDKTRTSQDDEDEEDDEHIDAALPPECMGTSGDTCAICIDTLEDDDDVRGLTCGHAFHAGCLDPWLTSRRACCPLCKADYYTPKPRTTGTEGADGSNVVLVNLAQNQRANMPSRPGHTWLGIRGRGLVLPTRFGGSNQAQSADATNPVQAQRRESTGQRFGFFGRDRLYATNSQAYAAPEVTAEPTPSRFPALREAFPSRFVPFRRDRRTATETPAANSEVSPSDLEAGVRPAEVR